jgi:hypothetical protein
MFRAQCALSLRSAARSIASLHDSLRPVWFLMHSKTRRAPGLMVGHCSWISVSQGLRTPAILTSAALRGSVKSWKCPLIRLDQACRLFVKASSISCDYLLSDARTAEDGRRAASATKRGNRRRALLCSMSFRRGSRRTARRRTPKPGGGNGGD